MFNLYINTFDLIVENFLADILEDGWSAALEGWCLPGSSVLKVENYLADILEDGWSADMEGWCLPRSNGGFSPPLQALDEGKSPYGLFSRKLGL